MDQLQSLREHIARLLRGGQAYETFEAIVADFPAHLQGIAPTGAEHSAWEILEHMRISQRDILDFSLNENRTYKTLRWPQDYWPASAAPPDDNGWRRTVEDFLTDRAALEALVLDPNSDLYRPFPWGEGQTLLREALLAADHASYHLGQIVIVRRLLGA